MPRGALWSLRLIGPVIFIAFGLDQLRATEAWLGYIPGWAEPLVVHPPTFMRVHAVLNVVLGLWLLSGKLPAIAGAVSVLWMAAIVAATATVEWQIALRDLGILLGLLAYTLSAARRPGPQASGGGNPPGAGGPPP